MPSKAKIRAEWKALEADYERELAEAQRINETYRVDRGRMLIEHERQTTKLHDASLRATKDCLDAKAQLNEVRGYLFNHIDLLWEADQRIHELESQLETRTASAKWISNVLCHDAEIWERRARSLGWKEPPE